MDERKTAKNKPRKQTPACETENDVFASRLRKIMKERNVNQSQLEKLIKASGETLQRQTISLYMNGQSKPDTSRLTLLCRVLHVSSDYLLGLSEHDSPEENLREAAAYIGISDSSAYRLHVLSKESKIVDLLCSTDIAFHDYCCALDNLYDCAAFLATEIDKGDYDYLKCRRAANDSLLVYEESTRQIPIYQGVKQLRDMLKSPREIAIERIIGEEE